MNLVYSLTLTALLPAAEPFPYARAEAELSEAITEAELQAHVYRLASREFLGRRGPGAARAARYIADHFRRLKLQPAFEGSYFQDIPWLLDDARGRAGGFVGRNVAAILPGRDAKLKDEWVLLGAHYDHLGQVGGRFFPGADDNASGVAMLLEVAEHFALSATAPKRTLVFVAFDQEEAGLQGSTHFGTKPPFPFRKLKTALIADMLGRSMAGLMNEYVFALGSESAPQLKTLLETVPPGPGLKAGRLGADIIGNRSDYAAFRDRRVPYLFFSTGQHADYHQPSDTPDKIEYAKLLQISRWLARLTRTLAEAADVPVWASTPPSPDLDEVRTLHAVVSRVLEQPNRYPLTEKQTQLVQTARDRLAGYLQRGAISATERASLIWTARLLLASVF